MISQTYVSCEFFLALKKVEIRKSQKHIENKNKTLYKHNKMQVLIQFFPFKNIAKLFPIR